MEQNNFAENQSQQTDTFASSAPASEEMVPKSKAEEMARHAAARVAEKMRRERENSQSNVSGDAPNPGLSPEHVQQHIAQEVEKRFKSIQDQAYQYAQTQAENQFLNDLASKLEAGKEDYPEIEKTIQSLPLNNMKPTLTLAAEFNNTAGIVTELNNHPYKIAQIQSLIHLDPSMNLARKEIAKLSESIRINDEAKKVKTANQPLSQIQPSPTGIDSGSPSLKDLKRVYRG